MTKQIAGLITAIALTAGMASAQAGQDKKREPTPTVAGHWTMSVSSPHGPLSMGFVLEQDGEKVRGTVASPHGDLTVEGKFAEGSLTLATINTGHDGPDMTFSSQLND